MDVILHSITKTSETDLFDFSISFGSEPAKNYRAFYEVINPKSNFCRIEGDILKRLAELSRQRYHNEVKYRVELVQIIGAFSRGDSLPQMPATLAGTIQLERVSTVWRACGDETKTRSRASTGGAPNGAAPN
jgi:hypothetical protein